MLYQSRTARQIVMSNVPGDGMSIHLGSEDIGVSALNSIRESMTVGTLVDVGIRPYGESRCVGNHAAPDIMVFNVQPVLHQAVGVLRSVWLSLKAARNQDQRDPSPA